MALEAYRQDHGSLPRPGRNEINTGPAVLAKALVGPGPASAAPPAHDTANVYNPGDTVTFGSVSYVCIIRNANSGNPTTRTEDWIAFDAADGLDGPGFVAAGAPGIGGEVVSAYLDPDAFRMNGPLLLDLLGNPILYMTGNPRPGSAQTGGAYADFDEFAKFNTGHIRVFFGGNGAQSDLQIQAMLGDYDGDGGLQPAATVAEGQPLGKDFVLISAGSDSKYGFPDASGPAAQRRAQVLGGTHDGQSYEPVDDVTNID
jgi:hypothetical protein